MTTPDDLPELMVGLGERVLGRRDDIDGEQLAIELRALADRVESEHCTGVAARWCPVHGTCACAEDMRFNDPACPLHASESSHAAAYAGDDPL